MSGFTENRAPEASERPGPNDLVLTWDASRAMLPLVGRIAADVVRCHGRLARLRPEQARLERRKETLAWPERARRYQLRDEAVALERELVQLGGELEALGVVLLDAVSGLVGFPTVVNNRRAYFSWKPGEDGLRFWNFAGDAVRRPVPASWTRPPERPAKGKPRAAK